MLSDAVADVLTDLRAEAEALMVSTCTIRKPDGNWITDQATGEATRTPGTLVYAGKCRVRPAGTQAQTGEGGGAETFSSDYVISVPFSVTGATKGHLLTVDASPDAALVGMRVEVQEVDRGDHITARRLACNEVA